MCGIKIQLVMIEKVLLEVYEGVTSETKRF